ncbi:hypothetical protein [Campylobacter concisus]|jgi:hypothetical protein|uniref:hypothetical protein n=1 Tax=Campylobacter concisus TaxID=199 RepID=UPI000CD87A30|nr:hypothetical protein [Campylobacter concisus]
MDKVWSELILQLMMGDHPLLHWVIYNIFGLPLMFYIWKATAIFLHGGIAISKNNPIKDIALRLFFVVVSLFPFYLLIKFTFTKSNGYLVYPCVFSYISTLVVFLLAIRPIKQKPSETIEAKLNFFRMSRSKRRKENLKNNARK